MSNQMKTYNLEKYFSRKQAEKETDLSQYMLMAGDKETKTGQKYFFKLPILEMAEILPDLLSRNQHLYEILPPNFPVKPYFDLEMEREGLEYEECYDKLKIFVGWLKPIFKSLFGVDLENDDFVVLDSCRENKLSFHLVIQNKVCFENVEKHKIFITFLWDKIHTTEEAGIYEKLNWEFKEEKRVIFDKIPYGNYQNYRLVNQSKKGKAYILTNKSKYENIDTYMRG